MYAAQLSWWFAHFPKSSFKFIKTEDLSHDPLPLLDSILEFAEVDGPVFDEIDLSSVGKVDEGYSVSDITDLDEYAMQFLQLFFRQATRDLDHLISDIDYPRPGHNAIIRT